MMIICQKFFYIQFFALKILCMHVCVYACATELIFWFLSPKWNLITRIFQSVVQLQIIHA